MKTNKKLREIAKDILIDAREYPADVRDEVLDELIAVWAHEEGLSSTEIDTVLDMVSASR